MNKAIIILIIALLSVVTLSAQSKKSTVEVLYFKANLSCCKANACNALESDIQKFVAKSYPDSNVVFKEIKLADEVNKELVEKYKGQSQTVILVKKKKKKETAVDVSDIVKAYLQDKNKEAMEQQLSAKIKDLL